MSKLRELEFREYFFPSFPSAYWAQVDALALHAASFILFLLDDTLNPLQMFSLIQQHVIVSATNSATCNSKSLLSCVGNGIVKLNP